MTELNDRIASRFEEHLPAVLELSRDINRHPELAFEEHRTSAALVEALTSGADFRVERGVGGLDTAFVATIGSGELVVGICAEMDALPEIGHGCGHNVIGAASVGAAIALAGVVDEIGITLKVIGTPAEEAGAGKKLLLERGVFDGLHAAMMVHPALKDMVAPHIRASKAWRITYAGVGGHASRPWSAANAADATVIAQTAIGLLRQQLRDGIRVHHVVRDGGTAVNVIPSSTVVECMIRADDRDEVDQVWARVLRCFDAGALATDTSVGVEEVVSHSEFRHDPDLASLFERHAVALGRTFPDYEDRMIGSTDMAVVSLEIPSIHPVLSFDLPADKGNHTVDFARAAGGPQGNAVVRDGGLAMAWTVADAARSSALRDRLIAGDPPLSPPLS